MKEYRWCVVGFVTPLFIAYAGGVDLWIRQSDTGAALFLAVCLGACGYIPNMFEGLEKGLSYTTTSMTMEQVEQMIQNECAARLPSLRDQFAMAAIIGLFAGRQSYDLEFYATDSYKIADQMLAQRGKG